jgi:ankyrin repeat protein
MASSQRNPELTRYLLGLGADPGLGPLAAHFGSMRLCMMEKNAPYNLYYAASTGCLETLKLLLKYSKVDLKCACLLHGAVTGRSSEVLDHVLGLGIDVEEPDNLELTGRWGYKTPLHRAMAFGNVDAITILMTRGASVKRMGYQSVYDICGDDLLTPDLEGYEGNEIPKEIKDLVHKLSLNTEMA